VNDGFRSPEGAALSGFDRRFARIVRIEFGVAGHADVDGDVRAEDHAIVELSVNEPSSAYPYFVHVTRSGGRWYPGIDYN
jgi:hypothetical protein